MAGGAPVTLVDYDDARRQAEDWARAEARARAEAAGAAEVDLRIDWSETRATVEGREVLVEANVVAVAGGRPRF